MVRAVAAVGDQLGDHRHPARLLVVGPALPQHPVLAGARQPRVVDQVGLDRQVRRARAALHQTVEGVVAALRVGAAGIHRQHLAGRRALGVDPRRGQIEAEVEPGQVGRQPRLGEALLHHRLGLDRGSVCALVGVPILTAYMGRP